MLSAELNGAKFKLGGKVNYYSHSSRRLHIVLTDAVCQIQEIPGEDILKEGFSDLPISDVLKLEGIANRNSLPYAETYSLGELDSLRTIVRGTLR